MFVFDAFERATNMQCLAVNRAGEFSPVKNAPGPGVVDSPVTAREALASLHCQMLKDAGAKIVGEESAAEQTCQCEISPLVSYAGEGLEELVKGKTIQLPFQLDQNTAEELK